jgi:hypothetical protein
MTTLTTIQLPDETYGIYQNGNLIATTLNPYGYIWAEDENGEEELREYEV